ncbi:MAG: S9 family peptidase [Candidatus Aminicenantes bacterium]|nr:S9 family peptidase [Candidatus Aminicenantes bacterium]
MRKRLLLMALAAFLIIAAAQAAVGTAGAQAAAAADTHPFSVRDMLAMDRVSEPAVSPCGKWIVFTLRTTDLEANRGSTDLWLTDLEGKALRRLTTNPAADFNPRWAPDGKAIYFLSTRSGSSQVWRISPAGGEAEQVTKLPLDVANLLLSPDGKNLAFSVEVFPGLCPGETKKMLDKKASRKTTGRIYDRLFIRHWDTWNDGRRNHVFVKPVSGGHQTDLMKDLDADSPSKPFGGAEEFAFAPDGKGFVFTARDAGREEPWSTNLDLYYAPLDGSAAPRLLTADNKATDTQPSFSPDGKTLAFLAMERPGYEADRYRIMLRAWPDGGAERELAPNWDRSPSSICWSADGKTIYATAENIGQHSLFALDVKTGAVRTVVKDGSVSSPAPAAGGRVVFSLNNLKSPAELWSAKADGTDMRPVTRINAAKVAAARMGDTEQFSFKGWNDENVYGYVVKPADFDPAKKYPVAFLIHGGPQGSFGNNFHYRWNPQAYAGAGYGAVMVDFHGSTGYGQAFTDSIRGDWGGKPLEDLQKGLAAALERYPWLDGERVGALGASFGGYMINWIAGAWPDRFKCLVCHDGNLDERIAYYDTEELWFPEWDHMGTPWDNPEGYEKHNPVNLVKNWKTPMLVVHGALDFRVVETQGMSAFTALQRRGIPSKFLYFPDENHWVLQPHNSILWHETVIGWLDRWLK